MSEVPRVLILCTGNSCRSQMAEALWRHEAAGRYKVVSAGTHPVGVNPIARQVIKELGIDMADQHSKSVAEVADQHYDLVVTVCDSARENCPVLPHAGTRHHWPFYDPIRAEGTESERLDAFRRVRDEIRAKIQGFLNSETAA